MRPAENEPRPALLLHEAAIFWSDLLELGGEHAQMALAMHGYLTGLGLGMYVSMYVCTYARRYVCM